MQWVKLFYCVIITLVGCQLSHAQAPAMVTQVVKLNGKKPFEIVIPKGYGLSVAAQGLLRLRFLTISPDGRLFGAAMRHMSDNKKSCIYIFNKWDSVENRFTQVEKYLQNLRNVTQVAFYTKNDRHFLYIPQTDKLIYYEYRSGDKRPSGKPFKIATFPDYGLGYKYGGWHMTRSIAIHNNKLYVSVGSSCNACIEKETVRASILEMNPDGSEQKIFASGLRNAVGIKWMGDRFYATNMGSDQFGPQKPDDQFVQVQKNAFYGWPFYYEDRGKLYADSDMIQKGQRAEVQTSQQVSKASYWFDAHSAPLGFDYFNNFSDTLLNKSIVVALHGGGGPYVNHKMAVVKLSRDGNHQTIIGGFTRKGRKTTRAARPCGVLMINDHSFFVSDDMNGALYYIWKK